MIFAHNAARRRWEMRDDDDRIVFILESASAEDVRFWQTAASRQNGRRVA